VPHFLCATFVTSHIHLTCRQALAVRTRPIIALSMHLVRIVVVLVAGPAGV